MIELDCGLHEATRLIDPCPVCTAAKAANAKELAGIVVSDLKRAAWAQRSERGVQAQEDAMAMQSRYSDEQRADAVRRVEKGETAVTVAKELGCTPTLIRLWCKGKTGGRPAADPSAPSAKQPKADRVNDRLGDARPERKPRQPRERAADPPPRCPGHTGVHGGVAHAA